jgi:hypothetical protein
VARGVRGRWVEVLGECILEEREEDWDGMELRREGGGARGVLWWYDAVSAVVVVVVVVD